MKTRSKTETCFILKDIISWSHVTLLLCYSRSLLLGEGTVTTVPYDSKHLCFCRKIWFEILRRTIAKKKTCWNKNPSRLEVQQRRLRCGYCFSNNGIPSVIDWLSAAHLPSHLQFCVHTSYGNSGRLGKIRNFDRYVVPSHVDQFHLLLKASLHFYWQCASHMRVFRNKSTSAPLQMRSASLNTQSLRKFPLFALSAPDGQEWTSDRAMVRFIPNQVFSCLDAFHLRWFRRRVIF